MNITDMADTEIQFECLESQDNCKYWDYNFYAKVHDEYEYMQSMSIKEIKQLRLNCERILLITSGINHEQ